VNKTYVQNVVTQLKTKVHEDYVNKEQLETTVQQEHKLHDDIRAEIVKLEAELEQLRAELKKTHNLAEGRVQ